MTLKKGKVWGFFPMLPASLAAPKTIPSSACSQEHFFPVYFRGPVPELGQANKLTLVIIISASSSISFVPLLESLPSSHTHLLSTLGTFQALLYLRTSAHAILSSKFSSNLDKWFEILGIH